MTALGLDAGRRNQFGAHSGRFVSRRKRTGHRRELRPGTAETNLGGVVPMARIPFLLRIGVKDGVRPEVAPNGRKGVGPELMPLSRKGN